MFRHQRHRITDGRRYRDRYWILNDTTFIFFNEEHFPRLLVYTHALVNHTEAAFLRHGDGEPRFGNRIHGRRNQWNVQHNCLCQLRFESYGFGENIGVSRQEQNIVEC